MADFPVEPETYGPYFSSMEERVARLEDDMRDVKSVLSRLEPMIIRIDATLASTLPHLATKSEVSDLRGELTKANADLRGDLTKANADLRGELTKANADLRGELTKANADLRGDLTKANADLRAELTKANADLRAEMLQALSHLPTKTYMWGILGVLITAYGAGLAALAIIK